MHLAVTLVVLATAVLLIASFCERRGLPAPLILTIVGVGASFIPGVHVSLNPEVVLTGLLPPLLYAAAVSVSLVDFRSELRPIALLSVGLVIFTTLTVGAVTWWLLPIAIAPALALGAVVGPPDAVAATAIGRRIGLPRRDVTVLEGESLVNDATALVLLHTAIAAIVGHVTLAHVAGSFAVSALGGLVIGVAVGWLIGKVHHKLDDPIASTGLSLITPWVAFLPAEEVGASGVLAVVVAGLIIAHRAPVQQRATARLGQAINWNTIQFFLENAVFLLIGLQVRDILTEVGQSQLSVGLIVGVCAAVLATVVLSRLLWLVLTRGLMRGRGDEGPLSWRDSALIGWAGMRGVVTLAAVFILPEQTAERPVLVLAALVVVAGTLLMQGFSLPWLARRLKVEGPDPRADTLQEAQVLRSASRAGLARLEEIEADRDETVDPDVGRDIRARAERRVNNAWERLREHADGSRAPGEEYRWLRMQTLAAEREEVLRIRSEGQVDHAVLAAVMRALDVEESMLDSAASREQRLADGPVATPSQVRGECAHLDDAARHPDPEPRSANCEDCVREGTAPVHLRMCLTCGYVGCCDSSVPQHSTRHFDQTGHPVMRSFEPDEVWRWCYVDEILD